MKKSFHHLLFAVYPVLFLYSFNSDQTSLATAIWPSILSLAIACLLFVGLKYLLRDSWKASLAVTLLVVLFFSFGHVHAFIYQFLIDYDWDTARQFDVPHFVLYHDSLWELAIIWVVLLLWGGWTIWHLADKRKRKCCAFLNAVSGTLMAVSLVWVAWQALGTTSRGTAACAADTPLAKKEGSTEVTARRPDIYYIILDGFARKDVFEKHYNHDLSWLTDSLEAKGFTVVPNSRTNYEWTFLSLACSLNMEYLTSLVDEFGPRSKDRRKAYAMIRNNRVSEYLRTLGYRIVHLNSTWGGTMNNPFADLEIGYRKGVFQVEFYRVLVESTALKLIDTRVTNDLAQCHLYNLEQLRHMPHLDGPKFVFCHFVPPHHPYLFDREGNIIRNATVSNQFQLQKHLWADRKSYLDQAIFISRSVDEVVADILRESAEPPIIIIQSDHGPDVSGPEHHNVRLANFLAVHLPGAEGVVPPDETPVNLFPHIFNHYFQANLPIREKRHFVSVYVAPLNFTEMTFDE